MKEIKEVLTKELKELVTAVECDDIPLVMQFIKECQNIEDTLLYSYAKKLLIEYITEHLQEERYLLVVTDSINIPFTTYVLEDNGTVTVNGVHIKYRPLSELYTAYKEINKGKLN